MILQNEMQPIATDFRDEGQVVKTVLTRLTKHNNS